MFQKIIDNHLMTARLEIESALVDFYNLFKDNTDHLKLIVENWELFRELLEVPNDIGSLGNKYRPEDWGVGLTNQISWIKWFIDHEMLDDGEPRVLYYRRRVCRPLGQPSWIATSPDQATGCLIIRHDSCDDVGGFTDKSCYLTVDHLREAILFQKKKALTRETVAQWRGSTTRTSTENGEGALLREILRLTAAEFSDS